MTTNIRKSRLLFSSPTRAAVSGACYVRLVVNFRGQSRHNVVYIMYLALVGHDFRAMYFVAFLEGHAQCVGFDELEDTMSKS